MRGLIALLLLVAPTSALAQSAVELREFGANFGLTPLQVRRLFALYDAQAMQLGGLADALRVDRRTFRAAAMRMGARDPNLTADEFLRLAESVAQQAASARDKIDDLGRLIAKLDPGELRTRALAVLERGRVAFGAGKLSEAEQAFGDLEYLRQSDLSQMREAWKEAVLAQMRIAALVGENERASQMADRAARQSLDWGRYDAWTFALADGDLWAERGGTLGDNAALLRAIGTYRDKVLPLAPRDDAPLDWAVTQNNLGNALRALGERESGTVRLEEAVIAFRLAQEAYSRAHSSQGFAEAQGNLGTALARLGERDSGTARLEEAVLAYRAALDVLKRDSVPMKWAMMQNNLGAALRHLSERESGTARLEEAVIAIRLALEELTRARGLPEWAAAQTNLGAALALLGGRETGTARLKEAVLVIRTALEDMPRTRAPLAWAKAQVILGGVLVSLGLRDHNATGINEAVVAFRAALEELKRDRVPQEWAAAQSGLCHGLTALGIRKGTALLEEAVVACKLALDERPRTRMPLQWAMMQNNLGMALFVQGVFESGTAHLEQAVLAYRAALEVFTEQDSPYYQAKAQENLVNALALIAARRRQ